ncbi:MAG: hypothetical protein WDN28_32655 [Chthoniobacter sp.]
MPTWPWQQGEKAEQAGNMKAALAKLRSAAAVLDQIATQFPSWQPNIVEYRKTRTQEAIGRVQEKIARSGGGKADASDAIPGTDQPPLPQADNDRPLNFEGSAAPLPPPSSNPPARGAAPRSRGKDTDLFAEASQRMHKLQDDLQKAKDEAAQLQNEKATLARQLDDAAKAREASEQKQLLLQKRADNAEQALLKASTEGKADSEKVRALQADVAANKRALRDMRIEADADTEYRQQLDDRFRKALEKISVLTQQRNAATEASSNVPGKIEGIQKQLVEVQKEKDDLAARLQKTETQLSKVTTQRDDALAQVAKLQEAQKQVDKLVSDNAALMAKLSDAEKSINQFKLEGEEKDRQIASLKKEVGSVKEQLAQAKKESADYQRQMGDLQAKLEEAGKQLAEAKAENAANAADKKKMVEENSILRGIVLRQQKEEAVRAKTRKVVLGELADLELHSKTLLKEIDFLSQPVVKLTDKERSLFKKPELQISEAEISIGGVQDDAPADKAPAAAAPVAPVATPSAPAAPVAIPIPAPAPAAVPEVQVKATPEPATPEPATPAKSKVSDAPKVADNTRKSDLAKGKDKSKPVEAPPLPAADNPLALSLAQTPAPPIETAPQNIGPLASAKPMTNTPSTSSDQSAPPVAPDSPATTGSADASGGGGSKTNGGTPNVPPELLPLAREGKEEFERGNYLEAEKIYRKVLAKAPNNLYTLSNLGCRPVPREQIEAGRGVLQESHRRGAGGRLFPLHAGHRFLQPGQVRRGGQ